jgi:hypothetical protein
MALRVGGQTSSASAPARRDIGCPLCGSAENEVISQIGACTCKSLYRCRSCGEPFDIDKDVHNQLTSSFPRTPAANRAVDRYVGARTRR